jgi:hypothetical protein
MIESNENTRIVDYTFSDHGNRCDATSLVRCERGTEREYLEKNECLAKVCIVKVRKIR